VLGGIGVSKIKIFAARKIKIKQKAHLQKDRRPG
jgi:hypothetical protein